MSQPTPEMFRGLARSSPWRWRALSFELHRRPLHGPDHTVVGRLVRGVGLEVALPDGERHLVDAARDTYGWLDADGSSGSGEMPYAWQAPAQLGADGFVARRPDRSTADDPMWQDYQFVAMLDPVELADGMPRDPGPEWDPDTPRPPALDLHRVAAATRHGRLTWWAEVSPLEDYDPRCGCCPLLFGQVSEDVEARAGGPRLTERQPDLTYATAYLVALDVQAGVCVHVEHLDGTFVGRGFSLDVLGVDDDAQSMG